MRNKLRFVLLTTASLITLVSLLLNCKYLFGTNLEGPYIVIDTFEHVGGQITLAEKNESRESNSEPRIFCIVKTHPGSLRSNKTLTIFKVWVRKCANYRFVSLLPGLVNNNDSEAEIELNKPFYILKPKGNFVEDHNQMTQKVYAAIVSIYMRFPNYSWYYLSDDDVYANLNNMRSFLSEKNSSEPVTYGFNFRFNQTVFQNYICYLHPVLN
jgi:hypothetical protein